MDWQARVRAHWVAQVGAEYRSAAVTAELLHYLIRLGVSPDTLATCHRIVADELAHAELAFEVVGACGADLSAVTVTADELQLQHPPERPVALRAAAVAAQVFCCGETVALPLFQAMRSVAREGAAVAVLDRIVRDEAVHRAFGWSLLDELVEAMDGPELRSFLGQRILEGIAQLRQAYTQADHVLVPAERAWGLLDGERYREITERCIEEVIRPRFAQHGFPF